MIQPDDKFSGKVLGSCTLDRLIGRGGMSVVYHAQQRFLQRPVAVKILLPNVSSNSPVYEEFLARFLREANVIARLDHHNIIPIYECNLQDELAYLVMPYLTGGSLEGLLRQRGKLSLQEALQYMTEAAEALDYAHGQGIIHRDLKPSNFLLHADGHLVLADFGIAAIMQDRSHPNRATLTISGTVLGTPEYIAPEMALGKSADYRADIYELGIVLFQILAGYTPFKGRTPYEIMMRHINEQLPLLHQLDALIPPAVDNVLQKATAKNRDDRYNSAKEMVQELSLAVYEPYYPSSHFAPTVMSLHPPIDPDPTIPLIDRDRTEQLIEKTAYVATAPSRPAKGSFKKFALTLLLIALAAGLITAGIALAFPKPDAKSPAPLTPAQQTVWQYYNDFNQRNYRGAYSLASTSYSPSAYCSFVDGFAGTESNTLTFTGTPYPDRGAYNVPITLRATEADETGTRITTYTGYQRVKEVNGKWMIVAGGRLTKATPTETADPAPNAVPTQAAQSLLQAYYDDVNQRNYPAAYKLWGTAFHNSMDYCNFVNGYARTLHNDISFGNINQQNDGTVLVPITIQALEKTTSGTQTSTYQANYIVGQENGEWRILKGTMQKIQVSIAMFLPSQEAA